jgi:hypothetical protein
MATIFSTKSKRSRTVTFAAGLVLAALFGLGTFTGSADAQWRERGHGNYRHNWNGGYYRAPPVIYGSPYRGGYYGAPYYYPPPVVYGPGIGLNFIFR